MDDVDAKLQHIGESILLIFGAFLVGVLGVSGLDPLVSILAETITSTNVSQIAYTVIQFSAMMGVVVWYARVIDTEQLIPLSRPTTKQVGIIVAGTLLLLGGMYSLNWILQAIDLAPGANQAVLAGAGDPTYLLLMIPISILFVGPAEELLFRGAVQGRLRESWGVWPAIIVATVLFGLVHVLAVDGGLSDQLPYALVAAMLGIPLGYLYEYTRNIVVPAVIHGVYNATLFGMLYLGEIGVI